MRPHGVGWAKWLGIAQNAGWKVERPTGNATVDKKNRKRRRRLFLVINGVSAAAVVVWAAGGLGIVARGGLQPGWVGEDLRRVVRQDTFFRADGAGWAHGTVARCSFFDDQV